MSDKDFTWKPTKESDKLVENFINRFIKRDIYPESLGINFLYDYFCDSYNFWTRSGRELQVVKLVQIIGEPQLRRWDSRYEEYKYSYTEGLLSHSKVPTLIEIKQKLAEDNEERGIDISEEYERQRFHNKPEGLPHCILSTSLCSPNSSWCSSCISKIECINELRLRDRRTALKRGYIKL